MNDAMAALVVSLSGLGDGTLRAKNAIEQLDRATSDTNDAGSRNRDRLLTRPEAQLSQMNFGGFLNKRP